MEDEEIFADLTKVWEGKAADDGVYFTSIIACGHEKFISARTKKEWSLKHNYLHITHLTSLALLFSEKPLKG